MFSQCSHNLKMTDNIVKKYNNYCRSSWGRRRSKLIYSQIKSKRKKYHRILDLGCGIGAVTHKFLNGQVEIFAIDRIPGMLNKFKKSISPKLKSKIYFKNKNVSSFLSSYRGEKFDLILCHNILDYIENKSDFLYLLHKVAKKRCVLSVVVMNLYAEIIRKARKGEWIKAIELNRSRRYHSNNFGEDITLYTPNEWLKIFEKTKWNIYKWSGVGIIDETLYKNEQKRSINSELKLSELYPYKEQAILIHFMCSNP